MKITLFAVTYKNDKLLNEMLLKSLHDSEYPHELVTIKILNNFGKKIEVNEKFNSLISEVHHNTIRLDTSTGHLARDWNHGIMNAFGKLSRPMSDVVVLLQNDTIVKKNWYQLVTSCAKNFLYCAFGAGDQCQIVTPEAIKKIGMFDERFCNIGYQECDYFIRSILRLKEKCSINDRSHGRLFNDHQELNPIEDTVTGNNRKEPYHRESLKFHHISKDFLFKKWGKGIIPPWNNTKGLMDFLEKTKAPFEKMWKMYPYFEDDIDQNAYLTGDIFHEKELKFKIKLL